MSTQDAQSPDYFTYVSLTAGTSSSRTGPSVLEWETVPHPSHWKAETSLGDTGSLRFAFLLQLDVYARVHVRSTSRHVRLTQSGLSKMSLALDLSLAHVQLIPRDDSRGKRSNLSPSKAERCRFELLDEGILLNPHTMRLVVHWYQNNQTIILLN